MHRDAAQNPKPVHWAFGSVAGVAVAGRLVATGVCACVGADAVGFAAVRIAAGIAAVDGGVDVMVTLGAAVAVAATTAEEAGGALCAEGGVTVIETAAGAVTITTSGSAPAPECPNA